MRRIYKYILPTMIGKHIIQIPFGAKLLKVALQNNIPILYMIVEPSRTIVNAEINCHFTGNTMLEDADTVENYMGSVEMYNSIVYHYFSKLPF